MDLKSNLVIGRVLFFLCIISFLLLLYKDIFSTRTLIPNFEPFPDSIYYVNPALSFLDGYGFNLVREERVITPIVPVLYSAVLVPVFLLHSDPRMFYLTNIILALASLFLFKLILDRITVNIWIKYFVLFVYVTTYTFYWYPNLAMAENLILPLFLLAIWLLYQRFNLKIITLASFLVVSFYATKYAAFPISFSFFFIYLFKIFWQKEGQRAKIRLFLFYIGTCLLFGFIFEGYEYIYKNIGFFENLTRFLSPIQTTMSQVKATSVFSLQYMPNHLPIYLSSLMGGDIQILWHRAPLLAPYLAKLGLIGLGIGLFVKKTRFLVGSVLLIAISTILFMSTFYVADARYILIVIPSLLIGLCLFLVGIYQIRAEKKYKILFYSILVGLFFFYLATNLLRLKNQVMLNIKYAENPWHYMAIQEFNYFFEEKNDKTSILITAVPPYLVDYYSNKNYSLLPVSRDQEFRHIKEKAWGNYDYSNFVKLYSKQISLGNDVYVTNAGLGNEGYLHRDFGLIDKSFKVTKVKDGCFQTCNIYKVEIKDSEKKD